MPENVYLLPMTDNEDDAAVSRRLQQALQANAWLSFIAPRDLVAIKTHFGEEGTQGYVRPVHLAMLSAAVRAGGGLPFLTETQTLYAGRRRNAVEHMELAYEHGFVPEAIGAPIIMADGLLGDEEIEVPVPGELYQKVAIAAQIAKAQCLILVSHFTGHIVSGFGAALKNLGMGCASRRGKLQQHSTATPAIKRKKCTGCGECARWCPQRAIQLRENTAAIDTSLCIGCGECLAVCRFDAVGYNWSETYERVQKKITEHAMGVVATKENKGLYITFLNRISKDCDCMAGYEKIVPDIGVLISFDPVALDAAALALVEERSGKKLAKLAHEIPYHFQLQHAAKIGFGSVDYRLITL